MLSLNYRLTKFLSLLAAIILAVSLISPITITKADENVSGICGDNLTWTLDEEGTLTISGSGDMYDYSILDPEAQCPWYGKSGDITDVFFDDSGITNIGSYAFYSCINLKYIDLPESIISIGAGAFQRCSSLEYITIPESVEDIGAYVFSECSSLESIDIPESVSSIGNGAFQQCISLKSISIPESITSIGDATFQQCISLENIEIPDNVISIGYIAFNECSSLESIDIPKGVTSIGIDAFSNCSCLESIVIPESTTSIGRGAFSGCNEIGSISVESGNSVYDSREDCNAIIVTKTNLLIVGCMNTIIPDSVTSIGGAAFMGCSSLENITIPESVTSIGGAAFSNCSSLESIDFSESVTEIGDFAFNECSSLESISIPDSVTSIGRSTFFNCSSLESMTIPESVTSIGDNAFFYCSSLESIIINGSIEKIGEEVFCGCNSLKSIIVPDSVNSIGKRAFSQCFGLENITIPESVTSIENGALAHCISLKSIMIPENVKSIAYNAFDHCSGIQNIFYEGSEQDWEELNIDPGFATLFTSEDYQDSLLPQVTIREVIGGISVTIECAGSEIFYTLDGSIPCTASIPYEGTFILDEPGEYFIKARAFNLEEGQCSPVSTEYVYLEQSERPEIHERTGQIIITGEGDIYYTLDLAENPSTSSYKYTDTLRFDQTTVIKASCIEPGKAASKVAGYTFYGGSASGLTFPEESYSFENTKKSFGYKGFVYRIPEERYTEIFGSSMGEFLYDEYGADAWGGSCFGMSATSLLFHKGMLDVSDYSDEAESVNALHAPASAYSLLTQLIERYQISQFLPEVMEERGDISEGGNMVISGLSENAEEAKALLDAVRSGLAGGDPVILIVWRQDLSGSHAVVPYKVEDDRIYVYDCNNPNRETYISYRAGNSGAYTFRFGEYSYAVSYNLFSTLMNGIESSVDIGNAILSSEGEHQMLISADSQDITILDSNGQDATGLISYRATEDIDTEDTVMCLPAGSYRITNNDGSKSSITISAATDDDYHKITVHDPDAVIEVRERNGKVYFSVASEKEIEIESSVMSSAGYKNTITLTSTYAELYSTTDRTVVFRTKAAIAITNGEEQELLNDETDTEYYFGAAVSKDAEKGAKLFSADGKYTLATDITELPGEDFNLTVLATGGDENTMLYVASYSSTGRQIGIKGIKMTARKSRFPFSISKNAAEVKVFMLSADKYKPLINNVVIK